MDTSITLALTSALLFLILSSRHAVSIAKRALGLSEDAALIARTVVFGLFMVFVGRVI